MKKFIILAVMAVLSMLGSIGLTSCHNHDNEVDDTCYFSHGDSVAIMNIARTAFVNPTFDNSAEVFNYISDLHEREVIDEVIVNLSPYAVGTICNVLENKGVPLTLQNIVGEYNSNKVIYDSLGYEPEASEDYNTPEDTVPVYRALPKPPTEKSKVDKGGGTNNE